MKCIIVDNAEYKLLKEVFKFFSAVTLCAFSIKKHTVTSPLQRHRLWKHFDQAILFPFYPNPAHNQSGEEVDILKEICIPSFNADSHSFQHLPTFPNCEKEQKSASKATFEAETPRNADISGGTICIRCKKPATINCSCKTVSYCSKPCQTLEWPEHSKNCKQPDSKHGSSLHADSSSLSETCARCKKPATIYCSCKTVFYCSQPCQTLEWPEHSKKCEQAAGFYEPHKAYTPTSKAMGNTTDFKGEPSAIATSIKLCFNCNKTKLSLKSCKCRKVLYCSIECQRLHWPQHKSTCTAVRK